MAERAGTIASRAGLHARPGKPSDEAMDAASILSLTGLGAEHGGTAVLRAEGAGADAAFGQLVGILETDHDAAEDPGRESGPRGSPRSASVSSQRCLAPRQRRRDSAGAISGGSGAGFPPRPRAPCTHAR